MSLKWCNKPAVLHIASQLHLGQQACEQKLLHLLCQNVESMWLVMLVVDKVPGADLSHLVTCL